MEQRKQEIESLKALWEGKGVTLGFHKVVEYEVSGFYAARHDLTF